MALRNSIFTRAERKPGAWPRACSRRRWRREAESKAYGRGRCAGRSYGCAPRTPCLRWAAVLRSSSQTAPIMTLRSPIPRSTPISLQPVSEKTGFTVTVKKDLGLDALEQAVDDFADSAKGAGGGALLFRRPWLFDRDRRPATELLDGDRRGFSRQDRAWVRSGAGEPLEHIEETIIGHARATLIFVDACRDVPVLASRSVGSRGFAPFDVLRFRRRLCRDFDAVRQDRRRWRRGPGQPLRARFRLDPANPAPAHRGRLCPHPRKGARRNIRRRGSRRDPQRPP